MDMDETLVGVVEELGDNIKAMNDDVCNTMRDIVGQLIKIEETIYASTRR